MRVRRPISTRFFGVRREQRPGGAEQVLATVCGGSRLGQLGGRELLGTKEGIRGLGQR